LPDVVADAETWALFFHVLGAFLLVGGTIVAGAAFEAARRRRRPDEIALLLGPSRVGVALVAAGTLLVLPFGLWLVHLEGIGFGTGWIIAALALFVLAFVAGAIGGQVPKRARLLAERLGRAGEAESPELRSFLDHRWSRALNYVSALLILTIIALMVFKPG
jgi:uncharacterized membrane protein